MPSKTRRDPELIAGAPLELPVGSGDSEENVFYEMASSMASELEEVRAELDRLRTKGAIDEVKKTMDEVRAGMLEGYSNRVFWFVAVYCIAVGAMLLLAGWKGKSGFELSDTILGIIAGSTAVSVIGLIGMVISGLFGGVRAGSDKSTSV